jgi:hypothetical protein
MQQHHQQQQQHQQMQQQRQQQMQQQMQQQQQQQQQQKNQLVAPGGGQQMAASGAPHREGAQAGGIDQVAMQMQRMQVQPTAVNPQQVGDGLPVVGANGWSQHGSQQVVNRAPVVHGANGWSQHGAPDGHCYYYNASTSTSQWERPPEMDWQM